MSDLLAQLQAILGQTVAPHPAIAALERLHPQAAQTPQYDPNAGYVEQFNTKLTPEQEAAFQQWVQRQSAAMGRDVSRDQFNYDLRGAWLTQAQAASNGHMPDTYKKPNHPTFSTNSQYSTPETMGGQWSQQPDGSWAFTASTYNLKMNDAQELQQYWSRAEPGNKLILPGDAPTAPLADTKPPSSVPPTPTIGGKN